MVILKSVDGIIFKNSFKFFSHKTLCHCQLIVSYPDISRYITSLGSTFVQGKVVPKGISRINDQTLLLLVIAGEIGAKLGWKRGTSASFVPSPVEVRDTKSYVWLARRRRRGAKAFFHGKSQSSRDLRLNCKSPPLDRLLRAQHFEYRYMLLMYPPFQ